eukprot:2514368-Heterocapsa_arctica.AAC.1
MSSAQNSFRALLEIIGHALDNANPQYMATDFIYIGVLSKLARFNPKGVLQFDAMPGRSEALPDDVA